VTTEYEMAEQDIDAYHELRDLTKRGDEINAAINLIKARFKKLAGDADYLTMGGARVLRISRTYPMRLDTDRFKNDDPRLYAHYSSPAEAPVITLKFVDRP